MAAVHTKPTNGPKYSRCSEKSWMAGEEINRPTRQAYRGGSIAEKVDQALWNNGMLRSTDYRNIDIAVIDGVVFLSGHVISTSNLQKAENAARTIPGVMEVKSYLVSDDKLLRDVAGALAGIEQAHGVKFFTGVQNGVVGLHGEVSSANVRSLAEKCAAAVPGVRGVINNLRSPEIDLKKEDQRFLQPVIGEQVYFRDGSSGKVQRVIINPDNRRVVAMVVRGRYSSSPKDPLFLRYGEDRVPDRLVVLPTSTINNLTESSGFLHIDSTEAAAYEDFNLSNFTVPGADWTPPYPYCPDEVLFPHESAGNTSPTGRGPDIAEARVTWSSPAVRSGIPE